MSPASLETVSRHRNRAGYGKDIGRPKKHDDSKDAQIVILAFALYRLGAGMLEVAARKVDKTCIYITVSTCILKHPA